MSWTVYYSGTDWYVSILGQASCTQPQLIMLASCKYCFLSPGFTDVSSSSEQYLLFTAYSMTSAFAQNGLCITNSGAPRPIPTPYSVANQGIATADPTQHQSALATSFVHFLNIPDWGICGENGSLAVHMANAETTAFVNVAISTTSGAALPISVLSSSSTASLVATQSSLPTPASTGLTNRDKAAIGVVVSVFFLCLVLPGLVLWHKYRKQRAAKIERKIQEKLEIETETDMETSEGV